MEGSAAGEAQPLSTPGLGAEKVSVLPGVGTVARRVGSGGGDSPVPAESDIVLFIVEPPVRPAADPGELPATRGVTDAVGFPPAGSFLRANVVVTCHIRFRLSSGRGIIAVVVLREVTRSGV